MVLEEHWAVMLAQLEQNSIQDYGIATAIFLGTLAVAFAFKQYFLGRLRQVSQRTKNPFDDAAVVTVQHLGFPLYASLGLLMSLWYLSMPWYVDKAILYLTMVIASIYSIKGIFAGIDNIADSQLSRQYKDGSFPVKVLSALAKTTFLILIFLLVLSNFGVNITALIAGLGIGGLAIAFALQNILADLFSSFTIYFDKPFQKGDLISIGNDFGYIKETGIKSTRIQTLEGQELIVSNRELTTVRVNNYRRMHARTATYYVNISKNTQVSKVQMIPELVGSCVSQHAKLERLHLKKIDANLNFEVAYSIDRPDMKSYLDTQHAINLCTLEEFSKAGIELA
jgi:small-conductance mechanosensitive channel